MNSEPIVGAHALTGLVGIPLCIYAGIAEGAAAVMSAIIFTILLYQFLIVVAGGGPAVGIMALLVLFFEAFVLFTVCAILFGQEITLEAASYWKQRVIGSSRLLGALHQLIIFGMG